MVELPMRSARLYGGKLIQATAVVAGLLFAADASIAQDRVVPRSLAEVIAERRAEWPIAIDRDGEIMRVVVRG